MRMICRTCARRLCGVLIVLCCLAASVPAASHALPVRASPGAGATLTAAPAKISITFDDLLEPVFSTLRIEDAQGKEVAKGAALPDRPDAAVLELALPVLAPGTYHVFWSVVARDGHRTIGDYKFTVQ